MLTFSLAQVSAGAGSVVDYGLMVCCRQLLGFPLFWAIAIGGVVGAIINFTLNRYWTFRSSDPKAGYTSSLRGPLLRFALQRYAGVDYKLGKLAADLVVSVLFNYTLQRFWVFRRAPK